MRASLAFRLRPVQTQSSSTPRHEVPVRRPGLVFDDVPREWLGGNLVATHMFDGLNFLFPEGERFFIQSVKDHLAQVEDPELRRQIRGFFGQEAQHAIEHEHYFDHLETLGYRFRPFLHRFQQFNRLSTRWLPKALRLSITAAAEHYTATIGAAALVDPNLREIHPTMRKLIIWHACEEVEHKAVAFDVLQATHPNYLLRVAGFVIATAVIVGWSAVGTRMLVRQDKLDATAKATARKGLRSAQNPELERDIRRNLLAYFRPGFHPNQVDDLELAREQLALLA
jgi:predicted metal-dependent hydrolase